MPVEARRSSPHRPSGDLGYSVSLERGHAHQAGEDAAAPMVLRVTHVYRRIKEVWRVVHRHVDPLTSKTAVDAVLADKASG